jgi:hypothetical protein
MIARTIAGRFEAKTAAARGADSPATADHATESTPKARSKRERLLKQWLPVQLAVASTRTAESALAVRSERGRLLVQWRLIQLLLVQHVQLILLL